MGKSFVPPHELQLPQTTSQLTLALLCFLEFRIDRVVLTLRKIEQELIAAGHHVCILTTRSGNMQNTHMDGEHPNRQVVFLDNSVPIPFMDDPHNPDNSYHLGFSLSKGTRAKIAEFEPSLIHVSCPDSTCLHLIQYAREMEIPLMGTYHSNIPEYMLHYPGIGWVKHILAGFFRHQYNFLQALYVPTPFIHRYLSDTYKMDRITNLRVWGRGIDLDTFSPARRSLKFRRDMGFKDDEVVIMWCGRLVTEKRPDIFSNVVRRLHKLNLPFKALVVGAGPVEDEMIGLPNTVFAGWMNKEELAVAYASSDIFLFPSGVETFGNVTLEAAASGLPLVVNGGCSGHLVNEGVNGFACANNDIDAYFEGTHTLLVNHQLRKAMGEAGRQLSLNYEKRAVCRQMVDNYSKVTEEFYSQYGGRHANRDEEFRNEDSFLGGNIPRPLLLAVFEYVFVFVFLMFYHVATFVTGFKNFVNRSPRSAAEEIIPPVSATSSEEKEVELAMEPCTPDAESGHSVDSEVDSNDGPMKTLSLHSDDDTDSTSSSSHASSSETNRSTKIEAQTKEEVFHVSHALSKGFMSLMMFQFRLESNLRQSMRAPLHMRQWNMGSRKRKMSNFDGPEIDEKLSCDDDSQDSDTNYLLNTLRDDRLNMRRSNALEV